MTCLTWLEWGKASRIVRQATFRPNYSWSWLLANMVQDSKCWQPLKSNNGDEIFPMMTIAISTIDTMLVYVWTTLLIIDMHLGYLQCLRPADSFRTPNNGMNVKHKTIVEGTKLDFSFLGHTPHEDNIWKYERKKLTGYGPRDKCTCACSKRLIFSTWGNAPMITKKSGLDWICQMPVSPYGHSMYFTTKHCRYFFVDMCCRYVL